MTRRFARKPLRETMQQNLRAMRFYGMPEAAIAELEAKMPPPPKKRAPRTTDPAKPYERDILKAILEALKAHPSVAFAIRQTSGVFQDGNRMITVGTRGLPDVLFMLKTGRLGMIEAKRIGEKPHERQQAWLDHIAKHGGVSGVATSVGDALAIVDSGVENP